MERLDKIINILRLTPHRQPELVKEATHRILSRSLRYDPKVTYHLKPLLEILLKYCDSDDGAQRSLFNDHLNCVILAFQEHCYQIILNVLVGEVNNNGTARTVTAALLRIPSLIANVKPIELGYDAQKLLKSLIEIARRDEDESVQKALTGTLDQVVPYLDNHIRQSKEALLFANTLVDHLVRGLSSSTRRNSVLSLRSIFTYSRSLRTVISTRVRELLDSFCAGQTTDPGKFSGFCLAIKEIPDFAEQHSADILKLLFDRILAGDSDSVIIVSALEAARDTLQRVDTCEGSIDVYFVESLVDRFLVSVSDQGDVAMREDSKVILQANTLALISAIVQHQPNILTSAPKNNHSNNSNQLTQLLDKLILFRDHLDVAVRNQLYYLLGNYMASCWKFPLRADHSLDCEKVRTLWCEFRAALNDDYTHPDVMKSCLISMNLCINTLLQSDHCMHIVEYEDFERLIHLFDKTNFKPLKVEILNFFAKLDYLTLSYLELYHWSYYRSKKAGSFVRCIQSRIIDDVFVKSLTDDSQMIRLAATSAFLAIIPKLYMSESLEVSDQIVSLASDLAGQQSVIFEQANLQSDYTSDNISTTNLRPNERMVIRNENKILSSSILREKFYDAQSEVNNHRKKVESTNLRRIVNVLRFALENSLERGKIAVLSIVRTLLKLSKAYPIYQYPSAWDCRPSEHCECYILLNFLLSYLENLIEPDVVIEDLDAYQTFISMATDLLYALCHESVFKEYENQRMKPYYRKLVGAKDGAWSELAIKHLPIADTLQIYYTHLVKLLWLLAYVIEEKSNPFAMTSKSQQQQMFQEAMLDTDHSTLTSNRLFFGKLHKKLESSYRSSKKNLRKQDEKFQSIVDTCLSGLACLSEFLGANTSKKFVRDILTYLKVLSSINNISTLVCARQVLKSLFGINIIALYQIDPLDWFEEEDTSDQNCPEMESSQESQNIPPQGVYHQLVSNPYKIFSDYLANNASKVTPGSDRALESLDFESRRVMRVRYRIEEIVRSLFEFHPHQIISPRLREISELLKTMIAEFTPIVMECMKHFGHGGFPNYQAEVLHLMSYLILLRVNYQKLPLANDFITSINRLLDNCGDRMFLAREKDIDQLLRNSFTFLTLLTYDRGPSKAMFQVAAVIQKLDDIRAKLSSSNTEDKDVTTYVVPLLRCLVEDLFIYRTEYFHKSFSLKEDNILLNGEPPSPSKLNSKAFELLEAERETVAQKLMDNIQNPGAYDLLSILILESRVNPDGTKYAKLSQRIFDILFAMCCDRKLDIANQRRLELTKRIFENISTEVFKPVNFIMKTMLEAPVPGAGADIESFQRWMSLVVVNIHVFTTQVKEDKFLSRIDEIMSECAFIRFLFQIIQIGASEIFLSHYNKGQRPFLVQQLAYYIHYITYMFQSGLFFQLSKNAPEYITKNDQDNFQVPRRFRDLCHWAREPNNQFCLEACETMFYYLRYSHPDLTIMWCNLMMLLNNVDCNSDYWCNLLIYDCYHCLTPKGASSDGISVINVGNECNSDYKRKRHVNRPSSLNLLDISFNDQLRRSFIKKIAAAESRPKTFEKNNADTMIDDDGEEFEKFGQCLAPNVELSRRGALCLVLDYVSISMNDVEHITWLIIHHINDIIRWSYETPISEFINAVHGTSASSGIFIQAIDTNVNDLTSHSFVERLLGSLEKVHYTQYGSLVVLLVEKVLSSSEVLPYRALTKKVEKFLCGAVENLLADKNKSLITTDEETLNQLTPEDLDRVIVKLDPDLYDNLVKLLVELRDTNQVTVSTPTLEISKSSDGTEDFEPEPEDRIELLFSKANLIYQFSLDGCTAQMSTLLPAINTLKSLLSKSEILDFINQDDDLVCKLVFSIYALVLTKLPPPTRLSKPRIWAGADTNPADSPKLEFDFSKPKAPRKPVMDLNSRRSKVRPELEAKKPQLSSRNSRSKNDFISDVRLACLEGLFLFDNIDCLQVEQFGCVNELIIRLTRLPLINSFVLTPPDLWKHNIWPEADSLRDDYKVAFPLPPHEILCKDYGLLKDFCDRILKLGWINRRQFEEIWMTLLGVLNASLTQPQHVSSTDPYAHESRLDHCKLVIITLTRFLGLTRKQVIGDPISDDVYFTQTFDERVVSLVKSVRTNLSSLKEKTRDMFQSVESDLKTPTRMPSIANRSLTNGHSDSMKIYNHNLKIAAHKLRMSSILNITTDVQDSTTVASSPENVQAGRGSRADDVDIESCIRLILNIYKQKIKEPFEDPVDPQSTNSEQQQRARKPKGQNNQLPPPLVTTIILSILSLSDMFTDYEQFHWMFEIFMHMFKIAEKNEDEIQMQYLIIGLCKSTTICCYELPKDLLALTTASSYSHELMFEKCRQSIECCLRSDLLTLKQNALHGAFYMLEDSISIVASGAWELDDFEKLRRSRWLWIHCLVPTILESGVSKIALSNQRSRTFNLLEILCNAVREFDLASVKKSINK